MSYYQVPAYTSNPNPERTEVASPEFQFRTRRLAPAILRPRQLLGHIIYFLGLRMHIGLPLVIFSTFKNSNFALYFFVFNNPKPSTQ